MEQGPPGPNRQLIIMNFIARATAEAAEFFSRSITSELELQKALHTE
jgi:hypothetical protein